eukprot:SAG31_NODE_666_length_12962_cov_37.025033_4_plen_70_part_00
MSFAFLHISSSSLSCVAILHAGSYGIVHIFDVEFDLTRLRNCHFVESWERIGGLSELAADVALRSNLRA